MRLDDLPLDPNDLLSNEDKAAWAAWAETNRRRRVRIAMETGVPYADVR